MALRRLGGTLRPITSRYEVEDDPFAPLNLSALPSPLTSNPLDEPPLFDDDPDAVSGASILGLAPVPDFFSDLTGPMMSGGTTGEATPFDPFAEFPLAPPDRLTFPEYFQRYPLESVQEVSDLTPARPAPVSRALPAPAAPTALELPEPSSVRQQAEQMAQAPSDMVAGVLEPAGTALGALMDWLSRPNRASAAVAENLLAVSRGEATFDPVKAFARGITGESQITYSDVLKANGLENDTAAGIAGFLLDVALDPITYLSFGAGAAAKAAGVGAARVAPKVAKFGLGDKHLEMTALTATRAAAGIAASIGAAATAEDGATAEERLGRGALGFALGATVGAPVANAAARFVGSIGPVRATRDALGELFVPLYHVASESPDLADQLSGAIRIARSAGDKRGQQVFGLLHGADPEDLKNLAHYREGTMPVPQRFEQTMREVGRLLDDMQDVEIKAGLAIPIPDQQQINAFRQQMEALAGPLYGAERKLAAILGKPNISVEEQALVTELSARIAQYKAEIAPLRDAIKQIKDKYPGARESVLDIPYFPRHIVSGPTIDPTKLPTEGAKVTDEMRQMAARLIDDPARAGTLLDQEVLSILADANNVDYGLRRVFQTASAAISARYIPQRSDIALVERLAESDRRVAFRAFLDDMKQSKLAQLVDVPGVREQMRTLPAGWRRVREDILPELRGYAVPQAIAGELERYFKVWRQPGEINSLLRFFDQLTGIFKAGVTSLWPAFHARNEISNWFLGWLAGVNNPGRYAEALKLQRSGEIAVRGQTHKLTDFAEVLHSGFMGSDLLETTQAALAGGQVRRLWGTVFGGASATMLDKAKAVGKLVPTSGRAVGSFLEDNAKLAVIIDRLHRGESVGQAMAVARKYLFDYRDLTPFEKGVMSRLMPFYSWTRFSVPLMMEQAWQQPGKFGVVQKGLHNVPDIFDTDQMSEAELALLPIWMREQAGMQVGRSADGKPILLGTLGLPMDDLNLLFTRTPARTIEKWAAMLNPYLQIAGVASGGVNQSFFTGQAIDNPSYANYYRRASPALAEIAQRVPGLAQWLGLREREVTNSATGEKMNLWVSDNPKAMFIFLALPWSRFFSTARMLQDPQREVTEKIGRFLTGAQLRELETERPVFTFGGVDVDRVRAETNTKLEQAAQTYARALASGDPMAVLNAGPMYAEARKAAFEQQRGQMAEIEKARIAAEALGEGGAVELRKELRRQAISKDLRALEDYYNLSPFDFGSMREYMRAREAALARLGPEQRERVQRGKDEFLAALPPTAQRVERQRAEATEQFREFLRLRRDDLLRHMRRHGAVSLSEEQEERYRKMDQAISALPRATPYDEYRRELEKERIYRQDRGYWAWVKGTGEYNRDKRARAKRYREEHPMLRAFGFMK